MLNLILATNPTILCLLCDLWLWSLTGYFFTCPADLLICICSCELHKLLTHPTLLQSCCRLCSTPWVTCSRWTVKEQCSVLIRLLYLLTKLTISVYKSTLLLIFPVFTFSFHMLQKFFVIYHFLQSRRAERLPLKWFWIKEIHTCLLIFVSHLLPPFPCHLYSSQLSWVFQFVCFMVMHEKFKRGTDLDYTQLHFILCEAGLISSSVVQYCWWSSAAIWKNYQNAESLIAVSKSSIAQSVQQHKQALPSGKWSAEASLVINNPLFTLFKQLYKLLKCCITCLTQMSLQNQLVEIDTWIEIPGFFSSEFHVVRVC